MQGAGTPARAPTWWGCWAASCVKAEAAEVPLFPWVTLEALASHGQAKTPHPSLLLAAAAVLLLSLRLSAATVPLQCGFLAYHGQESPLHVCPVQECRSFLSLAAALQQHRWEKDRASTAAQKTPLRSRPWIRPLMLLLLLEEEVKASEVRYSAA